MLTEFDWRTGVSSRLGSERDELEVTVNVNKNVRATFGQDGMAWHW
jgi:hypothetical protein